MTGSPSSVTRAPDAQPATAQPQDFPAGKTPPQQATGARRHPPHVPARPTHAPGRPAKPTIDKAPPLTPEDKKEYKAKLDQVKKVYDSIKSRPDMAYAQFADPSKADTDLKDKSVPAQKKIIKEGILETSRNFRLKEGDTEVAKLFDHPLVKINPRMVTDDIDRLLADAKDIQSGKKDWRDYQTGFLGAQYLNYRLHQDDLQTAKPKPHHPAPKAPAKSDTSTATV